MASDEEPLAATLSSMRERAQLVLRTHMEAWGLRLDDGWRLAESTRDFTGGSELGFPSRAQLSFAAGATRVRGANRRGNRKSHARVPL